MGDVEYSPRDNWTVFLFVCFMSIDNTSSSESSLSRTDNDLSGTDRFQTCPQHKCPSFPDELKVFVLYTYDADSRSDLAYEVK